MTSTTTLILQTLRDRAAVALAALLLSLLWLQPSAQAERLKDVASIGGVRSNALIGYGLVVGLDGTGDQTTQTPFTIQSLTNMLARLGVTIPAATNMQLKNVAGVMVTESLTAFARPGEGIDVTVSSLGNAKSIKGGTLLMTPMKGADGSVYAIAQGNVRVAGAGASANGSKVQVNQLDVGRISNGALVERAVPTVLGQAGTLQMTLNQTDFDNAQRVTAAINNTFGSGTAVPVDGRTIAIRAPSD